jgi:CRISPR-associated protein Cmr3
MNEHLLLIEPLDPMIFRDGKPFSAGMPAKSLPFPLPATTAGAIRTRSGSNIDFENKSERKRLLDIRQIGPFLAAQNEVTGKWELAFAAPADAVAYEGDETILLKALKPDLEQAVVGCDLPDGMLPLWGAINRKVHTAAPRFWKAEFLCKWLAAARAEGEHAACEIGFPMLPRQKRTHVAIDPETFAAKDQMLFSTDGLEFQWTSSVLAGKKPDRGELAVRRAAIFSKVIGDGDLQWPALAPLGGERRLATWSELSAEEVEWPQVPDYLRGESKGKTFRLVLATPAFFTGGWKPEWCDSKKPPGTTDLEMTLISAAIPRYQPASGWDLRAEINGPKETRFLAPAGSVYFFRVESGNISQLWMMPVSDTEQDRKDGCGIVLIGES